MKPEDQRIAIALACGWKWYPEKPGKRRKPATGFRDLISPEGRSTRVWDDGLFGGDELPDFLHDLNACHWMEKTLKQNFTTQDFQQARYIKHLENLIADEAARHGWSYAIANAPAYQKAEAFLKALGLWK